MAKYESKGTWFDPALVAGRARAAAALEAKNTIKVDVYLGAPDLAAELKKIYGLYNRKGVLVDRAMQTLQEYDGRLGHLLRWHEATRRALPQVPDAASAEYFARILDHHGFHSSAAHIRGVYQLPRRW